MLRIWIVYKHPADYPDSYVARLWEIGINGPRATDSIIIRETLEDLRDMLEFEMHLSKPMRQPADDPVIVETWL